MIPPAGVVAVTGAGGRLGSALVAAVRVASPTTRVLAWHRSDLDLDRVDAAGPLLARDQPDLVVHTAAWTDVDACALHPELALRRNGTAVGELARACARTGTSLLLVSTNEVFDGGRTDRRGYAEDDPPAPRNPYGASKLAGEDAARAAFGSGGGGSGTARLWVVQMAWLFGPHGNDFPTRILAAADRLPPGEPLAVVGDEVGSPSSTRDVAGGIVALLERAASGGTWHLANAGSASRLDVARRVLGRLRPDRPVQSVPQTAFPRASDVPRWSVLDTGRAAALGVQLPPWEDALGRYMDEGLHG